MEALQRYSSKTYSYVELDSLFDDCKMPILEKPVKPSQGSDEVDIDVYETELEQFVKDKRKLRLSLKSLYSVIWGQCSNSMVIKLTSLDDQKKWKKEGDCGSLLQAIKQIVMKFEHKKHPVVSLLQQLRNFYSYRQRENHDIHRYYETFQLMVENIESFGGEIGVQPMFLASYYKLDKLSQDDVDMMESDVQETYIYKAKERSLAIMFILNARQDTYGQLTTDLENRYLMGYDDFLKTMTEAYDMISNYKYSSQKSPPNQRNNHYQRQGLAFFQHANDNDTCEPVAGRAGKLFPNVPCYRCRKQGHYANQCPLSFFQHRQQQQSQNQNDDDERIAFGFFQCSYSMMQNNRYRGLQKNWVLLDSQSNCDIFCNPALLRNIRSADNNAELCLVSNGGELVTNQVGDIPNYGTMWYSPDSLANILSLSNVRQKYDVVYKTGPTDPTPCFEVTKTDGTCMKFFEHSIGLYVHEVNLYSSISNNKLVNTDYIYSFLQTVEENEKQFTKRQITQAKEAKLLYAKIGRPSHAKFIKILNKNVICDCKVTAEDAKIALHIYGPDRATIKGKTVRSQPSHVPEVALSHLPESIIDYHSEITLCIDILFVNGVPFLHTISKKKTTNK